MNNIEKLATRVERAPTKLNLYFESKAGLKLYRDLVKVLTFPASVAGNSYTGGGISKIDLGDTPKERILNSLTLANAGLWDFVTGWSNEVS